MKLVDKNSEETLVFTVDRWLGRDKDDGDLSRELPVVTAGRKLWTGGTLGNNV